jgi:predicted AAA+ superfamily ATPase
VPGIWDVVRREVDNNAPAGSYLLAGSATPASNTKIHSGAGRIVSLRMRPLALYERQTHKPTVSLAQLLSEPGAEVSGTSSTNLADYAIEIVSSGLPGLLSERACRSQLDGYLTRLFGQELRDQGIVVRHPESLRAWLTAYAAATATTTGFSSLQRAAKAGGQEPPSKETTIRYRDLLTQLWLLDPLPAWEPSLNHLRSAGQAPKHFLADPALAARLLGANLEGLLQGEGERISIKDGTLLGALFEALAVLTVRVAAQAVEARTLHYRSAKGDHEIDIIVERSDRKILAIEVKLAATISDGDVRHLNWLKSQLGNQLLDTVIINTGPYAYRRKDDVAVIPLSLLGP